MVSAERLSSILGTPVSLRPYTGSSKNAVWFVDAPDASYVVKEYAEVPYVRASNAFHLLNGVSGTPRVVFADGDERFMLFHYVPGVSLHDRPSLDGVTAALDILMHLRRPAESLERPVPFLESKRVSTRDRIASFLPAQYRRDELVGLLDGLPDSYDLIAHDNDFVHGDFVDRNILLSDPVTAIDFESSHAGHIVEDLAFFLESIPAQFRRDAEEYFRSAIPFSRHDEHVFQFSVLHTRLRMLGSFVRVNKDRLSDFDDRLSRDVDSVFAAYDVFVQG